MDFSKSYLIKQYDGAICASDSMYDSVVTMFPVGHPYYLDALIEYEKRGTLPAYLNVYGNFARAGNMAMRDRHKLTLRERLSMYRQRVKDAWLVLRGKAEIE